MPCQMAVQLADRPGGLGDLIFLLNRYDVWSASPVSKSPSERAGEAPPDDPIGRRK